MTVAFLLKTGNPQGRGHTGLLDLAPFGEVRLEVLMGQPLEVGQRRQAGRSRARFGVGRKPPNSPSTARGLDGRTGLARQRP